MVVKDDLVFNNTLFRESGMHGEKLVRLLGAKGISRVDFLHGRRRRGDPPVVRRSGGGEEPAAALRAHPAGTGRTERGGVRVDAALVDDAFHAEQLARVQAVYGQVSPFRELPLAGLEEVVTTFLLTFRRGANLLRMLSPVKTHSEHTYTHAINVSILAMALAESLGLQDESVQAIGDRGAPARRRQAAHPDGDPAQAGRSSPPRSSATIMRHPLYGAAYLARVEGLTRLAVLVAFEHHRKYDTSGYPVLRESGRRQHAASQIVAIADFYDALRSHRPYRRSLTMSDVLGIMRKESGSGFNPGLLDRFTLLMIRAAAET